MQSLQGEKVDREMAKHNIDLLELMQDKMKGNLTSDELQLLTQLLFQLRMSFVNMEKKVEKTGEKIP